MKAVYKYNLEFIEQQTIKIPSNTILSVENQKENIVVYALVDLDACNDGKYNYYEFIICGTGHYLDDNITDCNFLGTVSLANGNLMYHVFYRRPKLS